MSSAGSVKVCVLMSAYNGERYLRQQLDSIVAQRGVAVSILVRDDGSTDGSLRMLRQYASARNDMTVIAGPNVGPARSYFQLLNMRADGDFIAFSDQDDVWEPDKLRVAVDALSRLSGEMPLLYCSALEYVDEELRPIGVSRVPRTISFENALVENIAVGCTVVINRRAQDLALRCNPSAMVMHDAWLYLLVTAFGSVEFDPQPHIRYRQHERNAFGARGNRLAHVALHLRRLLKQRTFGFRGQAESFHRCFGADLSAAKRDALEAFVSSTRTIAGRLKYAFTGLVVRQSALDALFVRVLIAAGRL